MAKSSYTSYGVHVSVFVQQDSIGTVSINAT